jgi:putative methylase
MKKKQLEMFLQQTPNFAKPNPGLEQYQTPAVIAADLLFFAYQQQDVMDKAVVDLGCGTGIFSFGSAVLNAKKVVGIDKDEESIQIAEEFARKHNLEITFLLQDISTVDLFADTVIMNPPFGAQKANVHADQVFLKKALQTAPVVYSLHLTKTVPFLTRFIQKNNACIDTVLNGSFPLKAQFRFHKKLVENVSVSILRIIRKSAEEKG